MTESRSDQQPFVDMCLKCGMILDVVDACVWAGEEGCRLKANKPAVRDAGEQAEVSVPPEGWRVEFRSGLSAPTGTQVWSGTHVLVSPAGVVVGLYEAAALLNRLEAEGEMYSQLSHAEAIKELARERDDESAP